MNEEEKKAYEKESMKAFKNKLFQSKLL